MLVEDRHILLSMGSGWLQTIGSLTSKDLQLNGVSCAFHLGNP